MEWKGQSKKSRSPKSEQKRLLDFVAFVTNLEIIVLCILCDIMTLWYIVNLCWESGFLSQQSHHIVSLMSNQFTEKTQFTKKTSFQRKPSLQRKPVYKENQGIQTRYDLVKYKL